ncbi:MAG: DUF2075 domain-containing protein [Lachnospiraceae bacterium]|nr:DUF2075 domain-containing protein [Lachnospiraceae bacterium]
MSLFRLCARLDTGLHPQEPLEYIKNVYYVLLTKGIRGTYIYVCDNDLREYLQEFIEVES